jgi:cell surface protein SprA
VFTQLKRERNKLRSTGGASFTQLFTGTDPNRPNNKISIMGNPSLGEVKTMIIGVRNISSGQKSGEVWVNEMRLLESNNSGGWAANGVLNMQLSDIGSLNLAGRVITEGFGGLEEGIMQRTTDNYRTYSFTANVELGKFFPDKAKVSIPLYYSVTK